MTMRNTTELLQNRLTAALEQYGAITEFCKKTGFSRGAVEGWRDGRTIPGVDKLDNIAAALGCTVSELLAQDNSPAESDRLRALIVRYQSMNQAMLQSLQKSLELAADPTFGKLSEDEQELIFAHRALIPSEQKRALEIVRGMVRA
jgi:transcriptional regulator with XRE-family HTH domain